MIKLDRDEIVRTLRIGYGPIIEEADDYRPLAQYIIDLCIAYHKQEMQDVNNNESVTTPDCKSGPIK